MKALVCVKRVVDYNVKVRVKSDNSGVELNNVKMAMNPFDEIAVEQAIRMKEAGQVEETIVLSIGPKQAQDTIRTGLAMGADRGIHIEASQDLEPLNLAKLIKAVVEKENPGIVLVGKQAIDGDNNQTGQMLAALLDWAQGTFASDINITDNKAQVTREVDGGLEVLELKMPAVFSVDLRLNEPRYASLPNIMKAKKKPMESISISDLGIELREHIKLVSVCEPPERTAGVRVGSVDELIDKLRNEAKVIS